MRVCNVQVFGEKGKVNDLLVSISVSYFPRNSKRKRLVKSVHVDVSLNMEGERKIDGIQND